jgi:hypothetical protein
VSASLVVQQRCQQNDTNVCTFVVGTLQFSLDRVRGLLDQIDPLLQP